MAKKGSSILYHEWVLKYRDELTEAEFGKLYLAIVDYDHDGVEPVFEDRLLRTIWKEMKEGLDENRAKWDHRCKANRGNGKLGGRPKKKKEEPETEGNPMGSDGLEEEPTETQSVIFSKNKTQKTMTNDLMTYDYMTNSSCSSIYNPTDTEMQTIIDTWNSQSCTQPIQKIPFGQRRYSNTLLCINNNLDGFLSVIKDVDKQEWFQKQSRERRNVKYDWFVDPNNYIKVVEGNYRYLGTESHKETEMERKLRMLEEM